MSWSRLHLCFLLFATPLAAVPIDALQPSRWAAQPGWVAAKPDTFTVETGEDVLVFRVTGAGREMPFTFRLRDDELDGDARYLLIVYRGSGLDLGRGNYFVHGWESTITGGLTFAAGDEARNTDQWQTLAIDLAALRLPSPLNQVALKVRVGAGGDARLELQSLRFGDQLPAGATVAELHEAVEPVSARYEWRQLAPVEPMAGWTPTPAATHDVTLGEAGATFRITANEGGMRWRGAFAEPLDLKRTPWLGVRYRATGNLGTGTYAIWLGNQAAGTGGQSVIALPAGRLIADGRWHRVTVRIGAEFAATHLAVGLDSAGGPVELSFGPLTFASTEPPAAVADLLEFSPLPAAWPDGRDGYRALPYEVADGRPVGMLQQRLGLSDWFADEWLTSAGVPFRLSALEDIRQTGTAELGTIELPLPADAGEIYLLTAAAAPPTEPFGISPQHPRPIELIDVPEQLVAELEYESGPPDRLLPIDVRSGRFGVQRGLGVQALRPEPGRRPTRLRLHDGMQTASFAILAATVRTAEPRVPEPSPVPVSYPTPSAAAPADFGAIEVSTDAGLRWSAPGPGAAWPSTPMFEVTLGKELLPPESWTAEAVGEREWIARHPSGLEARVVAEQGREPQRLTLRLTLTYTGREPRTVDVRFPLVRGLRLGEVDDLWYLYDKRGGIINRVEQSFREPLGEKHPLQCDGFFDPVRGLALACLTHDTKGQHHFVRLAKDETGGEWSPEHVAQDLAPGASWEATEAELILDRGDWRRIVEHYRAWLATWFQPPAAKPWWERTSATLGRNVHWNTGFTPAQRGALQPSIEKCIAALGACDMVHLFGWSATEEYGDWGDYDHYDQTVGGLENFRANIAAAQADGVAVSLYQDAYLLSEKSQFAGEHAREWAMKTRQGEPWFVPVYDAFNICPYVEPWQEYLSTTFGRIARDTGVKILYVDEYGATDGRWTCYADDHGHNRQQIPSEGEVEMLRRIRAEVGPEVALYSEYPPHEPSRQYLDGSYTYQAIWSVDQEPLAPHFIDLPRFVFPEFKQHHLIHYVPNRAGNWWPRKFPFFNGEVYRLGEPNIAGYDAPAMAFQRRAVEVQCAHRDAFSSHDVTPLVETLVPGVYANRFVAEGETVWTLYNATGRTVRQPVIKTARRAGATYSDGWRDQAIEPAVDGEDVLLGVELGPKGVGCLVEQRR